MENKLSQLAEAVELEKYKLTAFTGEVISETVLSSIELNVSGGGGHISITDGYGGGIIEPINVSSSTTHVQKLFVKNTAGVEQVFLNNPDESDVREGHVITFVQAHPKINKPDVYTTHMINHNTNQRIINHDALREIMDGYTWGFLLILAFLGLLIFAFMNPLNLSLLLRGILLVIAAIALGWKHQSLTEAQEKAFQENPAWQKFEQALLNFKP